MDRNKVVLCLDFTRPEGNILPFSEDDSLFKYAVSWRMINSPWYSSGDIIEELFKEVGIPVRHKTFINNINNTPVVMISEEELNYLKILFNSVYQSGYTPPASIFKDGYTTHFIGEV